MTYLHKKPLPKFIALTLTTWIAYSSPSLGADFSINYDRLSFFEEPIAVDVFGFTLSYNQLYDIPVVYDLENSNDEFVPNSVFEVNIERQLPNALTVGATYAGSYRDDRDKEYQDAWAGYIRGVWGSLSGGTVTGLVREDTRRFRGVGNAELAFDDFFGAANDTGLAYRGQYSAFVVTGAGDEDGRFDVGVSYNRPSKFIDHRVTARYVQGDFQAANNTGQVETRGIGVVGEIIYNNLLFDIGFGFEELKGGIGDHDRYFVSGGVSYKLNQFSLSIEGHAGEIADGDEYSFSVGGRYDIARGMSVNLGYNYSDIEADFVEDSGEMSKLTLSMRYEY